MQTNTHPDATITTTTTTPSNAPSRTRACAGCGREIPPRGTLHPTGYCWWCRARVEASSRS